MQLHRWLPLKVPSCHLYPAVSVFFFAFCFWSTLPSPCMLVLEKTDNAIVYEMILVRIEKSHPHYSTTRSDVPCARMASLLTVPVCTCLFFLPVLWNTVLFLLLQVSHLCLDYTFTKVTVFPLCADIALVSYSALQVLHTCLVCLFGMIAYIFILGEIGYPFQFYLLVRDTRINKQFEQLCHETDSSISLAFPAPHCSSLNIFLMK